jgi:hypothetical protein
VAGTGTERGYAVGSLGPLGGGIVMATPERMAATMGHGYERPQCQKARLAWPMATGLHTNILGLSDAE